MNAYDSVFADASKEETEFEVMFDTEDDLIDTIAGCNENGDPLTGADPCPSATAEDRSDSDSDVDYEGMDADDSKDAPKDAEGTEGYDFENKPEIGKKDDQSTVDVKDVKNEEDPDYQDSNDSTKGVDDTVTGTIDNNKDVMEAVFFEAENELNGQDTNPDVNAKERSCGDCDVDYEGMDGDDSKDAPKDAEGTVGYDFEDDPEIGSKDDQTTVDANDVKIDEEVDFDITIPDDAEGTVGYDFKVNPEIGFRDDQDTIYPDEVKVDEEADFDFEEDEDGPTEVTTDGCKKCNESVDFIFEEDEVKVDSDVEKIETTDDYIEDDVIDDVESKDPSANLDYDVSDEDIINSVINGD